MEGGSGRSEVFQGLGKAAGHFPGTGAPHRGEGRNGELNLLQAFREDLRPAISFQLLVMGLVRCHELVVGVGPYKKATNIQVSQLDSTTVCSYFDPLHFLKTKCFANKVAVRHVFPFRRFCIGLR